jgi:hypothetical protein
MLTLEAGIMAQLGGVVAVLISCCNHHDAEADDVFQAMLNPARVAQVRDAGRQHTGQPIPALDLPQQHQPGSRTHVSAIKIKQECLALHG